MTIKISSFLILCFSLTSCTDGTDGSAGIDLPASRKLITAEIDGVKSITDEGGWLVLNLKVTNNGDKEVLLANRFGDASISALIYDVNVSTALIGRERMKLRDGTVRNPLSEDIVIPARMSKVLILNVPLEVGNAERTLDEGANIVTLNHESESLGISIEEGFCLQINFPVYMNEDVFLVSFTYMSNPNAACRFDPFLGGVKGEGPSEVMSVFQFKRVERM